MFCLRNFSTIFYIFVKYAHCTIETALICHSPVQVVHHDTAATLDSFSNPFFSVCSVTSIDVYLVYMKVLFGDFPLSWKCLKDKSATNTTVEKCNKTLTFPQHGYNLHVHPDCISFSHRHTCKTERVYYSVQSFSFYAIVFHSLHWMKNVKCAVEN